MKIPEQYRGLAKTARDRGWRVETRKSGHLRFTAPNGAHVDCSSSPSDHRAQHRLRSDLRRAGLSV